MQLKQWQYKNNMWTNIFFHVWRCHVYTRKLTWHFTGVYRCFEKGGPTKPYATMPKGFMGNRGCLSLIEALGFSATVEGNSTNRCIYAFSFLVVKHREPQSINAELFLPIIPIAVVAYALTLSWDNPLFRNSFFLTSTFTTTLRR